MFGYQWTWTMVLLYRLYIKMIVATLYITVKISKYRIHKQLGPFPPRKKPKRESVVAPSLCNRPGVLAFCHHHFSRQSAKVAPMDPPAPLIRP